MSISVETRATHGGSRRRMRSGAAVTLLLAVAGFEQPVHPDAVDAGADLARVADFAGERRSLGTIGGSNAYAEGIDERGRVVGWSETSAGQIHAFLWRADSSEAHGLNDLDQVVGESTNAAGERHGSLWIPEGGMIALPGGTCPLSDPHEPSFVCSRAADVNNDGWIAGWRFESSRRSGGDPSRP